MASETKQIKLSRGLHALVSLEDYERVSAHSWYAIAQSQISDKFYACSKAAWTDNRIVYLHRFILGATSSQQVDHRNGNTLDCTRENLRLCTHVQNMRNRRPKRTSSCGYRGVRKTENGRYTASISIASKKLNLGTFDCPILAACTYDAKALDVSGEFAVLNFRFIPLPACVGIQPQAA